MYYFNYTKVPKELNDVISGIGRCECYDVGFISEGQYQNPLVNSPAPATRNFLDSFVTPYHWICQNICYTVLHGNFYEFHDDDTEVHIYLSATK